MDLNNIETYLSPGSFDDIDIQDVNIPNIIKLKRDRNKYTWLAGGTWLFSEPQPDITGIIDIGGFGWDEIEVVDDYLRIGATCPLVKLLEYNWFPEWKGTIGFESAVSALSASFKVVNVATLGGNICLALSVGTFAPLMVALDASYEIWSLGGNPRIINAKNFQLGHRQTILKSGEILRRVLISVEHLKWEVNYQRFGIAYSDPALAIVVITKDRVNSQMGCVLGASVKAPYLLKDFPNYDEIQKIDFIEDTKASANYRREITQVLIQRFLTKD
ncbi:MAG: FAD binding domain-containing protein [Cyanobacteria bacterium P01_A01_bin.84]